MAFKIIRELQEIKRKLLREQIEKSIWVFMTLIILKEEG